MKNMFDLCNSSWHLGYETFRFTQISTQQCHSFKLEIFFMIESAIGYTIIEYVRRERERDAAIIML